MRFFLRSEKNALASAAETGAFCVGMIYPKTGCRPRIRPKDMVFGSYLSNALFSEIGKKRFGLRCRDRGILRGHDLSENRLPPSDQAQGHGFRIIPQQCAFF